MIVIVGVSLKRNKLRREELSFIRMMLLYKEYDDIVRRINDRTTVYFDYATDMRKVDVVDWLEEVIKHGEVDDIDAIIVNHINFGFVPDEKYMKWMTRPMSYFYNKNNMRIYEYAKMFKIPLFVIGEQPVGDVHTELRRYN